MNLLYNIFFIAICLLQIWLLSYFLLVFLFVVFDIFKLRLAKKINWQSQQERDYSFAAIVPLHQNIDFMDPILDSLLKQTHKNVHFYVIADDCAYKAPTYADDRIHIIYPEKPLHAKIKSIQLAIDSFNGKQFEAIAIFDADNLVHPDFFKVMNGYFNHGFKAVQSNILPKNVDSTFARLDSINDQYYNFVDKWSTSQLKLSAHIAGRGIVVDFGLYKQVSYTNFLGGFDKRLQSELSRFTTIGYAESAVIYDEKVDNIDSMSHQRTRWINTYFKYFSESWDMLKSGLAKKNVPLMFSGFNNMRPPLFIHLFLCIVMFGLNFFFFRQLLPAFSVIMIAYFLSFFYIVIFKNRLLSKSESIQTIFKIPLFILGQLRALFNIKKANKSFMQTQNSKIIFIEDILTEQKLYY